MAKIHIRTPKEVIVELKQNHQIPIFKDGFIWGMFTMSIFGIIVTLI